MVDNYLETGRAVPPEEAEKYAAGIGVMNDVAESLQRRGLLPKRFAQVQEGTLETITLETFLEGKRRETRMIGGKLPQQLEEELKQAGKKLSQNGSYILQRIGTFDTPEEIDLVWVAVQDLGLPQGGTFLEIMRSADALRFLRRCPAEVGPYLRLADDQQPMNTWYTIAMDPIAGRDGGPRVFGLGRRGGGLWLDDRWADPDLGWDPGRRLVFALRKDTLKP